MNVICHLYHLFIAYLNLKKHIMENMFLMDVYQTIIVVLTLKSKMMFYMALIYTESKGESHQ